MVIQREAGEHPFSSLTQRRFKVEPVTVRKEPLPRTELVNFLTMNSSEFYCSYWGQGLLKGMTTVEVVVTNLRQVMLPFVAIQRARMVSGQYGLHRRSTSST